MKITKREVFPTTSSKTALQEEVYKMLDDYNSVDDFLICFRYNREKGNTSIRFGGVFPKMKEDFISIITQIIKGITDTIFPEKQRDVKNDALPN